MKSTDDPGETRAQEKVEKRWARLREVFPSVDSAQLRKMDAHLTIGEALDLVSAGRKR